MQTETLLLVDLFAVQVHTDLLLERTLVLFGRNVRGNHKTRKEKLRLELKVVNKPGSKLVAYCADTGEAKTFFRNDCKLG